MKKVTKKKVTKKPLRKSAKLDFCTISVISSDRWEVLDAMKYMVDSVDAIRCLSDIKSKLRAKRKYEDSDVRVSWSVAEDFVCGIINEYDFKNDI